MTDLKKLNVTYTLLAIAVAAAVFFIIRSGKLEQALEENRSVLEQAEARLRSEEALASLDSALIYGDYSRALRGYRDELESSTPDRAGEIQFRINLSQQIINLQKQTRDKEMLSQEEQEESDSLARQDPPSQTEVRTYDSLLFALEKSRVQLELAQRRLKENAQAEYITFTSGKGNLVHFVGEVSNGKANGRGIALLTTGSRYVGEWRDNMRHGEGTFYWPDGEYYQGEYRNDSRHGKGTYYWPSGEKFTGQWEDDERNGQGVFFGEEGEVVAKGVWKNDELVDVKKNR